MPPDVPPSPCRDRSGMEKARREARQSYDPRRDIAVRPVTAGAGDGSGYQGHGKKIFSSSEATSMIWRCDTLAGRSPRLLLRFSGV